MIEDFLPQQSVQYLQLFCEFCCPIYVYKCQKKVLKKAKQGSQTWHKKKFRPSMTSGNVIT